MFNKDRSSSSYKPPQTKAKPLARGQSTLSSFFGVKKSTSPKLEVKRDRSQSSFSPPTMTSMTSTLKRTPSLLKKSHSVLDGFALSDEDGDDDIVEVKAPINNFKTILLPSPMPSRNSSFSLNPPQPTKRSGATPGENSVRANLLNSIRVQTQPKKRINPWNDSNPVNVKNPRLKRSNSKKEIELDMSGSPVVLSEEQMHVIRTAVKDKKNIFYTGSAGTGKSVLLRELVKQLKRYHGGNAVAVTASTGLAAVNIGGMTINRFSGCGIAKQDAKTLAKMVERKPDARETWKHTKVLIIDEVSMLDGDFLDKLEYVARSVTRSDKPFGGIQVILTGDFFQLPPVPDKERGMKFCFEAQCWTKVVHETILLKKVFRQRDTSFIDLLNSIRTGTMNAEIEKEFMNLSRLVHYKDGIQPTELYPTRFEVERANQTRLDGLPGEPMIFYSKDDHTKDPKIFDNTMAVKELKLKIHAQVMMLKNKDSTLVNGSVGRIVTFVSEIVFTSYKSLIKESELNQSAVMEDFNQILKCNIRSEIPQEVMDYAPTAFIDPNKFLDFCRISTTIPKGVCYPLVKFSLSNDDTRIEHILPDDFKVEVGRRTAGMPLEYTRSQLPLLLSWALSIHKSQGQTLDRVKVNLEKVFEAGQVYVALSRAVSKERLQVLNFKKNKIFTNKKVAEFYKQMKGIS